MHKPLLAFGCLLVLLGVSACGSSGGSAGGGSTIAMGSGVFSGATQITVKAGDSVTFDDSAGGPHDLVIGTGGNFVAASGAPSELNSSGGLMFNGGETKTVVFPTAGTFSITCKIHPSMQATVTVTA
jgi:plastocyanin